MANSMLMQGYKAMFPYFMVPKEVKIRNHRLSFLHRTLLLATLVFVVWLLTSNQSYLKIEEPIGSVAYWVATTEAQYDANAEKDFESNTCTNPEQFDYLYSEDWIYTGYSCTKIHEYDRYRKEGDSALFFPTSFNERKERTRLLPSTADPSDPNACDALGETCEVGWKKTRTTSGRSTMWTCECKENGLYFTVGLDSLRLGIEHSYAMIREATGELSSRQSSSHECQDESGIWKCDNENHALKTVVYVQGDDGKDKLVEGGVFISPDPIELHLAPLLNAAGYGFDSENTQTLPNLLTCNGQNDATCKDDAMQYPSLRITGMELRLSMKYYNNYFRPNYEEVRDHPGPSCVIIASIVPKWSSRPVVDCDRPRTASIGNTECVSRYYYGIAVSITTSGSFAFLDLLQIMLAIGAALSYFTLPFIFVHFIAMKLLGPLSKFYEQAADEELRVDNEIVSCMAQSLSAAASFRVLCDGDKGLDKACLLGAIHDTFAQHQDFDLKQQAHLAELVWDRLSGTVAASAKSEGSNSTDCENQGEGAEGAAEKAQAPTDMIILPQFVQSLAARTLTPSVLQIFDSQRFRNPLEIIFTPHGQLKVCQVFARTEDGKMDEEYLKHQLSLASEHHSLYASDGSASQNV